MDEHVACVGVTYASSPESTINWNDGCGVPHYTIDCPDGWYTWAISASLVANWLSGATPNYGLMAAQACCLSTSQFNFDQPYLTVNWNGDASLLYQPQVVHSNGAELRWSKFPAGTGASFVRYEVHRSATANFTASSANLIATITDPVVTRYVDTTAAPGSSFTYKIVTYTNTTAPANPSNEVTVTTPGDGNATAVLQPSISTYIQSAAPTSNAGSANSLYAQGGSAARTLLSFNLLPIPPGATVSSATLKLLSALRSGAPGTVELHQVTSPWDKKQATWSNSLTGVTWSNSSHTGGDFNSTVVASTSPPTGGPAWETYSSSGLASLVQSWVSGTANNFGMLFKLANETSSAYDQWLSENTPYGTALTPQLTVTYGDGSHALPPAVSMGAPGDKAAIGGTSVSLTAAASDDGRVSKVEFYAKDALNVSTLLGTVNGPQATPNAPWQLGLNSTTLARGQYSFTAKAYDEAGNTATSPAITVNVANSSAPTVGTPTVSGTGSSRTISATASDDRSISRVEFYANGDKVGTATGSPYTVGWMTGPLPGGATAVWSADTAASVQTPTGTGSALTTVGDLLTDATRNSGTQGDGLDSPDSSFGVWQGATNQITNGGFETNTTGWSKVTGTETLTRGTGRSRFGGASMQLVTQAVGDGAWVSVSASSVGYSASVWAYGLSGSVKLALSERLADDSQVGSDTVSTPVSLNGTWQRLSVRRTFTTGVKARLIVLANSAPATLWVDGAQIEQSAIATPYIETNGAAASRAAVSVQAPTPTSLLTAAQGWVAVRARAEWSSSAPPSQGNSTDVLFDWRTDGNNRYTLSWNEGGDQFRFVRVLAGVTATAIWPAQTLAPGDQHTVIAAWTSSSISISVDGGTFVTTSPVTGSPTQLGSLSIGSTGTGSRWDGEIGWAAFGTGTLTGTDAAALNGLGWSDPSFAARFFDNWSPDSYTITAKGYDDDGQVSSSQLTGVNVTNTSGTKYQVQYAATAVPVEMTYDPSLGTQTSWPVNVTLTNKASSTLVAAQTVLRYRWYTSDDTPVVTTSGDIPLGGDIASNANRTVSVNVVPPTLPAGVYRARYRLRFDLYDSTGGVYFAAMGNQPLERSVTVDLATPFELGLERFHQYDGEDLGGGLTNIVNLASGNNLVRWTPFVEPGRGLNSVLDLTYNSLEGGSVSPLGNNWSLALSSLTPYGLPLDIHPNASDTLAGRSAKWVGFTDGDGSYHVFTAALGSGYSAPAGVHLYLRQSAGNWLLTKPDGTTFQYNSAGYPTQVSDRNGNTLTITETAVSASDEPNGLAYQATQVTSPGACSFTTAPDSCTFTLAYYTRSTSGVPALRGKLKSITDHLGHTLLFAYFDDGNLMKITQVGGVNPDPSGDGSWTPNRAITFSYENQTLSGPAIRDYGSRLAPPAGTVQSPKLYSVIDFLGNETTFGYLSSGANLGRIATRTNRAGKTTSFSYPTSSSTTETMPGGTGSGRVWTYAFDGAGRVTSITDPVDSQPTTVSWTVDNTVARVTEPTGRHLDYAYNQNGYLTDRWDELGDHTSLSYQNVQADLNDTSGNWESGRTIPHLSQVVAVTEPAGNLIGNDGFDDPTVGVSGWSASSATRSRDATVANTGAASLRVITNNLQTNEGVGFDNGGSRTPVSASGSYTFGVWVIGTAGKTLFLDASWYNSAGSSIAGGFTSGSGSQPFTLTGSWQYVSASRTVPTGAVTVVPKVLSNLQVLQTFWVDTVGLTATGSASSGPYFPYTTQFDYDASGDVLHVTDPLGYQVVNTYNADGTLATQTQPDNGDGNLAPVTTFNSYDSNGLPTQVTDPIGGIARAGYDAAGNLISLQDPNHGSYSGGSPSQYQTQYVYDSFARPIRSSSPKSTTLMPGLLVWTDTGYDANDNVTVQMNQHYGAGDSQGAPVTSMAFDAMDRPTTLTSPDTSGNTTRKTLTVYDDAGRVSKTTTPNGVATGTVNDYTTETVYDNLDRPLTVKRYDSNGTSSRSSNYCYDLAGDLRMVVGPNGSSFGGCPAIVNPDSYTFPGVLALPDATKLKYDAAHRQIEVTNALGDYEASGKTTLTAYDESGQVLSTTDENGAATTYAYNGRGDKTQMVEPFDTGRSLTSLWEYWPRGQVKREISPRAYDASDHVTFTNYVTRHDYDKLDREIKTTLPVDASTQQGYVHKAYDADGNQLWISLPTLQGDPALVQAIEKTVNRYWDTGSIYSTSVPALPSVRYDYTGEGWQSTRVPETGVGTGLLDYSRLMRWSYYADGKLLQQTDQVGFRDSFAYDLDGHETSTTEALGAGTPSNATPLTVSASYDGYGELTRVSIPEDPSKTGSRCSATTRTATRPR